MSGTKSPSPTAPATEARAALIVAHGSPSAPQALEARLAGLARAVARLLPGWAVRGATLAAPGALESALGALRGRALAVYPLFMADGWFVRRVLPDRLSTAGAGAVTVLPPLGRDPGLWALCRDAAAAAAKARGLDRARTALLLAAHGSPSDPRPRQAAEHAARYIARTGGFRAVRTGFVDEAPFLAEAARLAPPALCLPVFALRAGHVTDDIPRALAEAGMEGPPLDPIGEHPAVPRLIARALASAMPRPHDRRPARTAQAAADKQPPAVGNRRAP